MMRGRHPTHDLFLTLSWSARCRGAAAVIGRRARGREDGLLAFAVAPLVGLSTETTFQGYFQLPP
jgi:hypothetical protein